jgi:hypothetical protein
MIFDVNHLRTDLYEIAISDIVIPYQGKQPKN